MTKEPQPWTYAHTLGKREGSFEVVNPERKITPWEMIGVTEAKFNAMKNYAQTLRRKFPQMKPDRVKRKVAEHFKVKLT